MTVREPSGAETKKPVAPPIDLARKTVILEMSGGLGERNIHWD
jgi:hypothetical protein